MPGDKQRLEAIKRQLEAQNEAWERMKATLLALGDTCFEVPSESLEALDQISKVSAPVVGAGIRG